MFLTSSKTAMPTHAVLIIALFFVLIACCVSYSTGAHALILTVVPVQAQDDQKYSSRFSSKPQKSSNLGSSSKSAVGLQLSFITPDQNGGVWLSGNALLVRGLLVNDGTRQLRTVTIQGVQTASDPHFVTRDIGWLTDYQYLYRSIDGGGSWSKIDVPGNPAVRSLYFSDVSTGWVGGWHGEIYRTRDAGQTWQKRDTGLDYEIQKLFFIDDLHGWANAFICYPNLRRKTALLKTTDGGETWETLSNVDADSPQSVNRIVFVNRQEGWGIDGWQNNVVHTLDGGKTWTIQQRREEHGWASLFFISPKEGWASGQDGILHTVNGGKTWASQMDGAAPLAAGCLDQIAFTDKKNGWVVCRDGALRTTDGGANWKPISDDWKSMLPAVEMLFEESSVMAAPKREFFVADQSRVPAHPIGAQNSYMMSDQVDASKVPAPFRFKAYCAPNERQLWTVGGQGEVLFLSTNQATRHFNLKSNRLFNGDLNGIYFNSEGVGWVVGDRGIIFHSDDYGNTWIEQSVGGEDGLSAVTCADNKTCWIVGDNGLILRTTDGGTTWTKSVHPNREALNAVDFIDSKNGWIAGNNGLVLRTEDGGVSWEHYQVPLSCEPVCDKWGVPLHAIRFISEKLGWVASTDQIGRTEDGGKTWRVVPIPYTEENQVVCIVGLVAHDEKTIWAINGCQSNYSSKDGGLTWLKMLEQKDIRSSVIGSSKRPRR